MGLLDEAIREHLELKRLRGADASEVIREEREALAAPAPEAELLREHSMPDNEAGLPESPYVDDLAGDDPGGRHEAIAEPEAIGEYRDQAASDVAASADHHLLAEDDAEPRRRSGIAEADDEQPWESSQEAFAGEHLDDDPPTVEQHAAQVDVEAPLVPDEGAEHGGSPAGLDDPRDEGP